MNNINYNFDYGNITEEHKRVVEEIVSLCDSLGNETLSELLKHKFKIVSRPRYDMESSTFVEKCRKNNIYCAIQGYVTDSDGIDYPIVSICEDIRKLNQL